MIVMTLVCGLMMVTMMMVVSIGDGVVVIEEEMVVE